MRELFRVHVYLPRRTCQNMLGNQARFVSVEKNVPDSPCHNDVRRTCREERARSGLLGSPTPYLLREMRDITYLPREVRRARTLKVVYTALAKKNAQNPSGKGYLRCACQEGRAAALGKERAAAPGKERAVIPVRNAQPFSSRKARDLVCRDSAWRSRVLPAKTNAHAIKENPTSA